MVKIPFTFLLQTVAFKTLEKDSSYRFVVDMLGDGVFTSEGKKIVHFFAIFRILDRRSTFATCISGFLMQ